MKNRIIFPLFALVLCLILTKVQAQDPHFSQYFSAPHQVNPAFTSLFQGDIRFFANHRNQWGSVLENPYQTVSVATDFKVFPVKRSCDYLGIGINAILDKAGELNFRTMQANLSIAYFKDLGGNGRNYLSAGFSAGFAQRSISINPTTDFLDGTESLPHDKFSFLDLSAGLLWYYYPKKSRRDNYYYVGTALFHLNRPDQSFFARGNDFSGEIVRLNYRQVIHGGASLEIRKGKFYIQPSIFAQLQHPNIELNLGSYFKYVLGHMTNKENMAVYLGGFYRFNDAAILAARMDIKDYYFTFSYDINTSNLKSGSNGAGGFELSLVKVLFNKNQRKCPDPYDCPKF